MLIPTRALLVSPAALILLATIAIAASDVPSFDVTPSCRGAAMQAQPIGDINMCVQKEKEVRDQLAKQWDKFPATDKTQCVGLSTMAGEPTYTELLTCLEMARDVRDLHTQERTTTGQGSKAR